MANILDYLDWRGDIAFSADLLNEVDNVIFSQLAYCDLEGIPELTDGFMKVSDVRDAYFAMHTVEEIQSRKIYTGTAPLLLSPLADSKRFSELEIGHYVNILDKEKVIQFSAVIFRMQEQTYVAFRGTDNSLIGWKEDLYFSYRSGTGSQVAAVAYLNEAVAYAKGKLHVGGHSKGGNLAIYAAAFCKPEVYRKIVTVWGNDNPGFPSDVIEMPEFQKVAEKMRLIAPESSIIGQMMKNITSPSFVKSDAKLIQQHDLSSWQVKGNHFETVDRLSEEAVFVNQTIQKWLHDIPVKERKEAIEIAFYCLEKSNARTFAELNEGGFKILHSIMKASKELSEEQSRLIGELFSSLVSNGGALFFEAVKTKIFGSRSETEPEAK